MQVATKFPQVYFLSVYITVRLVRGAVGAIVHSRGRLVALQSVSAIPKWRGGSSCAKFPNWAQCLLIYNEEIATTLFYLFWGWRVIYCQSAPFFSAGYLRVQWSNRLCYTSSTRPPVYMSLAVYRLQQHIQHSLLINHFLCVLQPNQLCLPS